MSLMLSVALLLSSTVVLPGGEDGQDLELTCETGPVDREYGGSTFSIFSCDDDRSVVVVAKRGSAAYPFYFIVSPLRDEVRLYGEGDGDGAASRAAFADLNEFVPEDVADLVRATKARG